MTVVMTVIMPFVITMIVVMVVFVIIVAAMIFIMVIVMIFVVIVIMVIVMIMILVIIVVIIDMNLAIEMFSFSPNQRRSDSSLDREGGTIAEAPLKNATKQTIDGVMPWVIIEVVIKTTMALDGDDGSEIEFTGLERLSTTTMGAMGFSR